ncbi:MAG: DUF3048 domain-containing protein [Patescibacteria group bacterium]|jgi:hypothetical protein
MTNATKKTPFNLETFLKRSWPIVLAGAVLVLLIAGVIFSLVLRGKTRNAQTGQENSLLSPTSTTIDMNVVPRHLDGIPVPNGMEALMPVAVMIENSPDARPLSGVSAARVVVEAPVEGGITRFMVVYDASSTVEQIGPVRSARPYYVDLADALNAVYVHVGGSAEALQKATSLPGFRNLDEFFNGGFFWRSAKRAAPHNVYTRSELITKAVQKKEWEAGEFTPWRFLSEATTSTERGNVTSVNVPYGGTFNVAWTYDEDTNRYIRRQAGIIQKDADGTVVSSTNVLILRSEEQVLDDYGRLKIRTTGSGKSVLFRSGKRFDVTWRRTAGEWFTFESVEGGEIFFEPGQTWISIVTSAALLPATLDAASSTNP